MLNISPTSVSPYINKEEYQAYQNLNRRTNSKVFLKILILTLIVFLASMLLPWTQNIRSNGVVTTVNAYDKPQNVQSLIAGKIDKWHVKEGDIVQAGDTIVTLTEAKEEYLDPALLDNTKEQQVAKEKSAEAYKSKSAFLKEQLMSLDQLKDSKLKQLGIKKQQINLEIESLKQELLAAQTYAENAANQLERMQRMFDKGIKSLTDLESKRLSNREAKAKLMSAENKLMKLENEQLKLEQEMTFTISDYEQKYAKVESEILSADSYRFSMIGESNKLQSKYNQIEQRQNAFIVKSPISGQITKLLKNGIGEYVKGQEKIATIVPTDYEKAVELFIEPNDMPLIVEGKKVRIQFDGWPAIVFSGWPDNSFGTFGGIVYAIDNDISENGKYRILVIEDTNEKRWPDLIRIGSGARGLLLLNDVKVYYELWRQLNGFPPDFYKKEKTEKVKNKSPLRKFK